jgi:hypothetical protein
MQDDFLHEQPLNDKENCAVVPLESTLNSFLKEAGDLFKYVCIAELLES